MEAKAIRIGLIAELTGPLSFMGVADANVARMVVDEINAGGGLLGRRLELCLEDGATTDSLAAAKAAKLVEQDQGRRLVRRHLQLHPAGDQGARGRQGRKALHLPGTI